MTTNNRFADAIRMLSAEAIEAANSGHPGAPMGMADIAEVLWNKHLRHNPKNPAWSNRDRFVLSNGHGSMLLYSLLHLTGYDLSLDDIRQFRQLHSKTPGHPEYGMAPGVETTTGPLGQGLANAVGMAIAEKILGSQFNRPDFPLVDHFTYVFLGDGCLMEGISHEACSLAGTLKLNKLIAFWDDNGISIDGQVSGWFTDNTPERFESYGWHVIHELDGHDADAIDATIQKVKADSATNNKSVLICCQTKIGYGSPGRQGTAKAHGAPLGSDEIKATRDNLDWQHAPFEVPEEIYQHFSAVERGEELQSEWQSLFTAYEAQYPVLAKEFNRRMNGKLPRGFGERLSEKLQHCQDQSLKMATRNASQQAIQFFSEYLPELIGGSADLAASNLTNWTGVKPMTGTTADSNAIHFGVREFAMMAICNGLQLHGGFIAFGATFLTFSDYARNALRMAALMRIPMISVFTHDSIGVGEDGPTHQPVEHISSLRLMPNMHVWRPCDAVESFAAWSAAIQSTKTPHSLVFSRQGLPTEQRDLAKIQNISRGGYVLVEPTETPQAVIIATGSEVSLAVEVAAQSSHAVRVVSMPCADLFKEQDKDYQNSILPAGIPRIAIEAGVTEYWYQFVGLDGLVIGLDRFGESGKADDLFEYFGFSVAAILPKLNAMIR